MLAGVYSYVVHELDSWTRSILLYAKTARLRCVIYRYWSQQQRTPTFKQSSMRTNRGLARLCLPPSAHLWFRCHFVGVAASTCIVSERARRRPFQPDIPQARAPESGKFGIDLQRGRTSEIPKRDVGTSAMFTIVHSYSLSLGDLVAVVRLERKRDISSVREIGVPPTYSRHCSARFELLNTILMVARWYPPKLL